MFNKKKPVHINLLEVDGSRSKYPSFSFEAPGRGIVTIVQVPPMTTEEFHRMIKEAYNGRR